MKNSLTILLSFVMIISFSQEIKKRKITSAQIDAIFSQWDTPDKPGIAVGILNDGEIVHSKGYGLANLEHQIPVNPETKFHIGDLAKEFTVYTLLLLEKRRQLSLEDDIRKHIPKLASLPHAISIKELIHHTSGLNSLEVSKVLAGWRTDDVFTKEQAYTMILNQMSSLPNSGSIQRPSDVGFMILEDLITEITKTSYTDFVTEELFEPLGMTTSVFDTESTVILNKAQGYFPHGNSFTTSTMNHSKTLVSDVYTTVGDMCLWAKELLNPKIGTKQIVEKFDGLSVVNNKPIEQANTALYTGGHRFWNYRGAKKLYHREVAGGYSSKLIRYPDYDLAIVIMENDGVYNGHLATRASALYIEDYLEQRQQESPKIVSKNLSKKQLTVFEGDYWDTTNHMIRKIHIVNDTLRYYRSQGNESPLLPITDSSFKMITQADVTVSFDSNSVPKNMLVTVGDDTFNLTAYNSDASWTKNLNDFTGNYYADVLGTTYSLILDKGKLTINHPRMDSVQLDPKIPDLFSGNQRHFSSLEFKRNPNGTIKGFKLATFGINDIWFQKKTNSTENLIKTK